MTSINPTAYQALAIRGAIKLYAQTGIKANRDYTPTNMLKVAGRLTGKTFKRGQFQEAYDALSTLVDMPTVQLKVKHD